jgi:hypothetical protein
VLWCVTPTVPDAVQKMVVKANIVAATAKLVFLRIAFPPSN